MDGVLGAARIHARILIFGLLVGASLPATAHATAWIKSAPQVRIRIVEAGKQVQLRGFDLKFFSYARHSETIGAPQKGRKPTAQSDRVSSWRIDCPNAGVVRARMAQPEHYAGQPLSLPAPVLVESPAGFLSVEGRPYREKVMIHPIQRDGRWGCEFVNHVDIEKYLDGLVNAEFNASWGEAAVDTQVIAARTYAYYQMKVAREKGDALHFDLDSTIRDQVYDGSMREDYRSSLSAERTKGLVLKASAQDEWPIKAYYHSTCGGTTELPELVWGRKERGFKRRSSCPYCRESPSYIWDVPLDAKSVAHQIWVGARNLGANQKKITKGWPADWSALLPRAQLVGLSATHASPTGRAGTVLAKWRAGERNFQFEIPATQFRFWVGTTKLKSTSFQIFASQSGGFILRGKGYGHGVGLCQWGAKVMGGKGKSREAILKLYYPDAVLARAW